MKKISINEPLFDENLLLEEDYNLIIKSLKKILEIIIEPNKLNLDTIKDKNFKIYEYCNAVMILAESWDILVDKIDLNEIHYEYMLKIRENLYNINFLTASSFSGSTAIGFSIYSLYKNTLYYKKFINTLNQLIISQVKEDIKRYMLDLGNVRLESYDSVLGLSGTASYLLLFKEEEDVRECIIEILIYLIEITKNIEKYGYKVPGWYTSSENQFLDDEKKFYKKGNFNLGLAHGIAGPLTILSLALKEGIEIEGQREGINIILNDLKRLKYNDEKENIYWPGRIDFEEYVSGVVKDKKRNRASWCYGTPGIARAMYIAGTAINDKESIDIAIKAVEGLCQMDEDEWKFHSPTICHGYSGLLAVVQAMYTDTRNLSFDLGRKKILKKILEFFEEDSLLGFYDIDPKDPFKGELKLIKKESIGLLDGAAGIILILLSLIKPIKTDWMRILMLK